MSEKPVESASRRRLSILRTALDAAGLWGAILSRPQHLFYFTGTLPGRDPAFAVVTPERVVAIAPQAVTGFETELYSNYDIHQGWSVPENAAVVLERVLADANLAGKHIGVERAYLAANFLPVVQKWTKEQADLKDVLWNVRKIRDADEIAQIEANVADNDRVFARIQQLLRPGVTEFEVWGQVYQMVCAQAGDVVTLEADLGVGLRGVRGDAKPGNYAVAAGDGVFLDVYSARRGYYADTTRSFVVGEPSARHKEVHAVLLEALAAGQEQLRAGTRACDVDAAVRGVVESAGFGAFFPHHSGHAYNVFQQDKPYFIPAETTRIETNMVVTLEPGIYIPGWGGMRVERNYVVGNAGARILDRFPIELTQCGG